MWRKEDKKAEGRKYGRLKSEFLWLLPPFLQGCRLTFRLVLDWSGGRRGYGKDEILVGVRLSIEDSGLVLLDSS